jgi:hypothetical protein
METTLIILTSEEVGTIKMIVLDQDKENALQFLIEKILPIIMGKEKNKLHVDGKSHL